MQQKLKAIDDINSREQKCCCFIDLQQTFRGAEDEHASLRLAKVVLDAHLDLVVSSRLETVEPVRRHRSATVVVNSDHRTPRLHRFFLPRVHLHADDHLDQLTGER